mgnify:CR=1 FL=1
MFIYIVTVFLPILLLLSSCDRLETSEDVYASYEQLKTKNEPGNWIPRFIPPSATDIKGRHKVDTGAQLLTFYFEGDINTFPGEYCKQTTASEIQFPKSGFLDVTWWPPDLVQGGTYGLERYKLFLCERQAFLAVTEKAGRPQAFYWCISFILKSHAADRLRSLTNLLG